MSKRRGHGEGGIFKRPDGRWCAQLDLGWHGAQRRRKLYYAKTRDEARRKLDAGRRAHEQGLPIADERQTTSAFLTRWLADCAKPSVRPSTYQSYAGLVRLHLAPELGRIPLVKLAPSDVQGFMNRKLAGGLSPRTVQYLRAVLRRALNQALRWGLVARNVATLVDAPRSQRHEIQPLTPEQARAFLDAVKGDRLEALYTVALALGLRQGEALGLQWQAVALEQRTLTVRVALQKINGKYELVEPKTAKSRRTIPLPDPVVAALRLHRVRQLEERIAAGPHWQEHGLLFTTQLGTPLDASNVYRYFQRHLAKAGLPQRTFHSLRHSCASLLLAQGHELRVIMEVLGHSQISLTANTYTHVMPSLKRDAADSMAAVLWGASAT